MTVSDAVISCGEDAGGVDTSDGGLTEDVEGEGLGSLGGREGTLRLRPGNKICPKATLSTSVKSLLCLTTPQDGGGRL